MRRQAKVWGRGAGRVRGGVGNGSVRTGIMGRCCSCFLSEVGESAEWSGSGRDAELGSTVAGLQS